MVKQSFKKAGLLLLVYIGIIIGIFILQFRNESLISNITGLMRMSVSQIQNEAGEISLKNVFQVSFNGISFSADESAPAVLTLQDGTEQYLTLLSWEQATPLSYSFIFEENTSITFTITDTTAQASLSIAAHLPKDAKSLTLNYKPASGYSVTDQSSNKQTVSSKNTAYTMTAPVIEDRHIRFTKTNPIAMYAYFDESSVFTFSTLPEDANATLEYAAAITSVKEKIISLTEAAIRENAQLTENAIAAYVAEMASQGQFDKAIATIPDSFKKGSRRTYITAPYFNTLVQMNPSLVMANENMQSMIENAVSQKQLDIFAVTNIADYMMRENNNTNVKTLAAMPASTSEFQPTISQATGIINTYLRFANAGSQLADSLSPVIDLCLDRIAQGSKLNGNLVILTEKDLPVTLLQSVETGKTLVDYGEYTNASEYVNAGRIIIATAFDKNPQLDLYTVAELYPMLVSDSPNYPHMQLFGRYNGEAVWAWTAATELTYTEDSTATMATITIDFNQGSSHYFIMNGIRPFSEIEIYGVPFRTDSRFETYNSSGYVYNERTHTLMIKSRQKAQKETIRLTFRVPASAQ
ncbi:MAG: hypothetical protein K6G80_11430 [Treponema sp.]|nr:hypothetical protein [Treponema sp.]